MFLTVWCLTETGHSLLTPRLILLQVLIHSLLSMFHPRPFIKSRFAPQGTVACIRASNDFYYDIVFRWGAAAGGRLKDHNGAFFFLLSHQPQNFAYFASLLTNIKSILWILMVMSSLAASQAFILKSACRDGFLPRPLLLSNLHYHCVLMHLRVLQTLAELWDLKVSCWRATF